MISTPLSLSLSLSLSVCLSLSHKDMWAESAVMGMCPVAFHTMNDADFFLNVAAVSLLSPNFYLFHECCV